MRILKTFIIFNFCFFHVHVFWKQVVKTIKYYGKYINILILLLCYMRLIICVSYVENWLFKYR